MTSGRSKRTVRWTETEDGAYTMTSNLMSFRVEHMNGSWHLSCTDGRLNGWFLSKEDAVTYAEFLGGVSIGEREIPMPLRTDQILSSLGEQSKNFDR